MTPARRAGSSLPHGFPFRFVDAHGKDHAVVQLSAAARFGAAMPWPRMLAVEILAQSAACLLSPESSPRLGMLVAIEEASFHSILVEHPLAAGDTLVARIEERGRHGRLLKVRGVLEREGERIVKADLVLAIGVAAG